VIADYASQVRDYFGESFVVEPERRRKRVAAEKSSRRTAPIRRQEDVYLNGTVE
jgi:hypothetical protein